MKKSYRKGKVEFSEETFCESCLDLEPYTPVLDMEGAYYCLDCFGNDELSKDEYNEALKEECILKIQYYNESAKAYEKRLKKLENTIT
ncbi:hypothetical protein [Pseudobutyrivibrio sp.]